MPLIRIVLSNAWIAVVRDIAFVAVGFVIIFVQLFLSYRKLSMRPSNRDGVGKWREV